VVRSQASLSPTADSEVEAWALWCPVAGGEMAQYSTSQSHLQTPGEPDVASPGLYD
jgi:hypothetical protein